MRALCFMKPMLKEQPRSLQILVGMSTAAAAAVSAITGLLYASNLEGALSLIAAGMLFFLLVLFFATAAYRLIRNSRRKDGGLLPRWAILIGSLLFSAYYVIYVIFSDDLSFLQLLLGILGIPLFLWVGTRTFKARERGANET